MTQYPDTILEVIAIFMALLCIVLLIMLYRDKIKRDVNEIKKNLNDTDN